MKMKYQGMTLVELMVSLILFTVIVTGISTFDIFGNFHAITFDRRATLQNELSLVLEHMTKTIVGGSLALDNSKRGGAIGDRINEPANYPFVLDYDETGFRIRIDSNNNGRLDPGDAWVGYQQVGQKMYYYPNDNAPNPNPSPTNPHDSTYYEVIANHLCATDKTIMPPKQRGFYMTTPLDIEPTGPPFYIYNACNINLHGKWYPDLSGGLDNPEARMTATIIAPSTSTN